MTQRPFPVIPVLALTLAALACSVSLNPTDSGEIPTASVQGEETGGEEEPPLAEEPGNNTPPDESQPEPPPAVNPAVPTHTPGPTATISANIPPGGAFITTPNDDVAGLPTLTIPPTGIGGVFCEGPTSGNISFSTFTREFAMLCLYGLDVSLSAPSFIVTVNGPDGSQYKQTYTILDQGSGPQAINVQGKFGGSVFTEDFAGLGAAFEPSVGLSFYTGANVPAGQWSVSVDTADDSFAIPPTNFVLERSTALVSDAPQPAVSPIHDENFSYSETDTIYFYGDAYTPGQTLRLALYTTDPAGAVSEFGTDILVPRNATTVTVDANGRFEALFIVGAETLPGRYYVITDDQFDEAFEDAGFMQDPFTGAFRIE